jgi:hypothetical protein
MDASTVLHNLTSAGIKVIADDGNLRAWPRSRITDAYRQLIWGYKLELLALLQVPTLTVEDEEAIAETIDERAAIREYDGGEPPEVAEREAHAAMRVYRALIAMPDDRTPRWVTILLPGVDDVEEARQAAGWQFGPDRVIDVVCINRATTTQIGKARG